MQLAIRHDSGKTISPAISGTTSMHCAIKLDPYQCGERYRVRNSREYHTVAIRDWISGYLPAEHLRSPTPIRKMGFDWEYHLSEYFHELCSFKCAIPFIEIQFKG